MTKLDINNYITPNGLLRLKKTLLKLIDKERPEVVRLVSWAASNGDRSENADYIYKNNISEVNSFLNKKYEVPKNFSKIYELKINKIKIYEIYKLKANES